MDYKPLVREAFEARKYAYAPYSNFLVGASLLAKNGKIYRGCNIENAGFSPTNCAERTAIFKAVSEGVHEFEAIAVVGGSRDAKAFSLCFPCGVCRQVLTEFCRPDLPVIVARSEDDFEVHTLRELLPHGFGGADLQP
ncbi:cytidine deaminase [Oscillospiraceae bacterium PP1C4]